MSADREWENWGNFDPYYGVLAEDKYRKKNLTPEAKAEFFDSGARHIQHVLGVCRRHLDQDFSPKRALDFGCGTGRLVIPLARIAELVVGLDVSESMLSEARKNCEEHGVRNISLLKSDDRLSSLEGCFDWIHSFIVFQHIPPRRGRQVLMNLLKHLNEGGISTVQFTYSKARYGTRYGVEPLPKRVLKSWLRGPYRALKQLLRRVLPNCDPEMQVNAYNLNELLFTMQTVGIRNCYVEYTDHGGELGVFLYFQKARQA